MIIEGNIIKIAGPVIIADGMRGAQMLEMVRVGDEKLIGEIIELEGDTATIQVYEETAGIQPGEVVECTGGPLSVELGPGVMSSIFDGIQRPLRIIREESGDFIARGIDVDSVNKEKKWTFKPVAKVGDVLKGGDVLGEVQETTAVLHKIMVPPTLEGEVTEIAAEGEYTCTIVESATAPEKNELTYSEEDVVSDGTFYALANKPEADGVGFYPVKSGVKVPAGKAYLEVGAEVKGFLALGDVADAINNIAVETANGTIFNIAGQKVQNITKGGLYIVNGKKVLVK